MSSLVTYNLKENITTITMDDGNKNVISPQMIEELNMALDQAEKDNSVVILTGREGVLSAGFDLKTLRSGVMNAYKMITGGFKLSQRLLSFPTPLIIACNGHGIAMGSFILLSGDYRIGTKGDYKIVANEVAIGLTMPHAAIDICRQRLKPNHFNRAVLLAEQYNPETAIEAGFLDESVESDKLLETAMLKAEQYATLDLRAHKESKLRMRKKLLKSMKWSRFADKVGFFVMGIKRALGVK